MKITAEILSLLRHCASIRGGAANLARQSGVDPGNLSRYLNGKVRSISDDNWEKLVPFLKREVSLCGGETIRNTAQLREFIKDGMLQSGITGASGLAMLIGYPGNSMERLLKGEINFFPQVLSAVFAALELDENASPLSARERELLPSSAIFRDGGALSRPVPVVDTGNAAGFGTLQGTGGSIGQKWDVDNVPSAAIPAATKRSWQCFRVHGDSMEPGIAEGELVLAEPVNSPEEVPDGKVVLVKLQGVPEAEECVVCKRLRHLAPGEFRLLSDNPSGRNFTVTAADVEYLAVVRQKICDVK